jgi:hypothetical protein
VIRFTILVFEDVPDAVQALLDTADAWPEGAFTVGPFDSRELEKLQVWVDGDDEVEAADILAQMLLANDVRWAAA